MRLFAIGLAVLFYSCTGSGVVIDVKLKKRELDYTKISTLTDQAIDTMSMVLVEYINEYIPDDITRITIEMPLERNTKFGCIDKGQILTPTQDTWVDSVLIKGMESDTFIIWKGEKQYKLYN